MGNSAHELKHGTSGTSGAGGSSGTSGIGGTSGTSGVSGTSGTSGNGTSGTSGVTGSSGTSGTTPSLAAPGTIGGTTPGDIYGLMPNIYITESGSLTALQCSKTTISNYGMTDANLVAQLPTAVVGMAFICFLPAVRAKYFKFRADTNDKIYLSGVAGADNGYVGVASGYSTMSSCQMVAIKASDGGVDWFCIPIFGTWVAS